MYDRLVFPDKEAEVIDIIEDSQFPIRVWYEGLEADELIYTTDGRYYQELEPSLATKPYTIEGFEQKAPVPTYEEAVKWLESTEGTNIMKDSVFLTKGNYYTNLNKCTEALRKLIILRDYYNDGWQPDWNNRQRDKFGIMVDKNMLCKESFQSNNKPLTFKSKEIRDRFFEEQRELLEIAKPLL